MKKLFTLAAAVLASLSLAFAAETSNVGTYSTQVVSSDGLTSTWTFPLPSSQLNVPTGETEENGIIYAPSASGKMKFTSSNQFSWQGQSSGYIYVPAGGAGTITMTVKSSSDSRFLQLYVNGAAAAETKRLWSKYAATASSDGKTGPQSFAFTADDLTTKGGKTYLHFKDNNTEMKIATFSITLTTGTYADCDAPTKPLVLSSDAAETVYVDDVITFTTGETGNGGEVSIEGAESETISENKWTAVAGTHTFTASQAKNGNYCAQESELKLTVLEKTPVTAVTVAGPTAAYKGNEVSYTATAANATAYRWKVDGAIQAGAETATFVYTANAKGTFSIVCEARNTFNAAEEWIPSEAKELTVSLLSGEIIAFTAETGSSSIDKDITAIGIVGGTVHQKSAKDGKLNSENYYSLKLATGNFLAGDTVKITQKVSSKYVAPTLALSSKQDNSDIIGEATGITAPDDNPVTTVIVLTKNAEMIYLSRTGAYSSMNPIVASMSVVRPMPIKSTIEALDNVKVNGVAISAADLTNLKDDHYVNLDNQYAKAPVVTFTKKITTTYEDESSNISYKDIEVTAKDGDPNPTWEAEANIAEIKYKVIVPKAASHTVTYKFGEKVLGSETVGHSEHPAEYTLYQTQEGYNFGGWYREVELEEEVAYMDDENIDSDVTYYAKFTKIYLTKNVNIEQLVLNQGTKYDIASALTDAGWLYNDIDALDSLNDSKASRNEPFLGLKLKKSTSYISGWLKTDGILLIKFGNVGCSVKFKVTGETTDQEATFTAEQLAENGYEFPLYGYTEDVYVKISLTDAKTVVLKQLMLDEIAEVTLPYGVVCAATENGTLAADKKSAIPGEKVTLTVTPDAGYKVADVQVNGKSLNAVEGVYSFLMPAENVTVTASFAEDTPSAIDNTEAAVKAVKMVENGMLIIKKDGKTYNVLGQTVR